MKINKTQMKKIKINNLKNKKKKKLKLLQKRKEFQMIDLEKDPFTEKKLLINNHKHNL